MNIGNFNGKMTEINLNKKFLIGFFVLFIFLIIQFYSIVKTVFAVTATDDVLVTLDVTTGIAITPGADVTMLPSIGISNDSAIGSSAWTVKTNAAAGYTLAVKANTTPALTSGLNSFADYHAGTTPATWSVSNAKEFGYSAYGTDTTPMGIWGTGASCGVGGIPTATLNYAGFTTSDNNIATRASVTDSNGIMTTICFAAEQNVVYAPSGTYTATITATATTL